MIRSRPEPQIGDNSGTADATGQMRSYFERWQRLEEEKANVADDLKNLFSEAKGFGFNTKAMRSVFRDETGDKDQLAEFEAICDLYRSALSAPRVGARPARMHEGRLTIVAGKDKHAGEIQESAADLHRRGSTSTENVSDEISESDRDGTIAASTTPAGSVADAIPSAVSMQEPRDEAEGQGGAVHEHGREEGSQPRLPSDRVENKPGATAVIAGAPIPPVGAADVHSVVAEAGAAVASVAPAEDFQPLAFLTKPRSPLRPHCLHPEMCAGYGKKHCGSCLRVHEAAG